MSMGILLDMAVVAALAFTITLALAVITMAMVTVIQSVAEMVGRWR